MAHVRQLPPTVAENPTVHNGATVPVTVRIVVHDEDVTAIVVTIEASESYRVSAPSGCTVEVHTETGSATALIGQGLFFLVREDSVHVVPE